MALEIEHKFLLKNNAWKKDVSHFEHYKQGYLSNTSLSSIAVRLSNNRAWLNIKSLVIGNQRLEFEYEIKLDDAAIMLDKLCDKPLIEKIRHFVDYKGHTWEIDEFLEENIGLIVAEVELLDLDECFEKPDWIGEEVTYDLRYYNNNLSKHPYKTWHST